MVWKFFSEFARLSEADLENIYSFFLAVTLESNKHFVKSTNIELLQTMNIHIDDYITTHLVKLNDSFLSV